MFKVDFEKTYICFGGVSLPWISRFKNELFNYMEELDLIMP